jgi:hypothetical protein
MPDSPVQLFGLSLKSLEFSSLIKMPVLMQQQGSLTPLEKAQVALLMAACQPKVIIETGVWRGRTTRFMAEFLSINQIKGQVYAFDLPEILDELKRGDIWFSSAQNVTLMPGALPDSLMLWLRTHNQSIDFALVDAYHSFYAVMKELNAIAPHLSEHGYIFCHDYGRPGSKYEGVMCAVNEAAKKFGLAVLPLWSMEEDGSERSCQAAILHRKVKCSTSRKLFHWRKYFAQELLGLASLWGRIRHRLIGD